MGFELSLTPASPSTRQFTPCRVLLLEEMIGLHVPLTIRPIIDDRSVPSFTPFCNVTVRYDGNDVILYPRHCDSLAITLEDGVYTDLRIPGTEHLPRHTLSGSSEPFYVKVTLTKC